MVKSQDRNHESEYNSCRLGDLCSTKNHNILIQSQVGLLHNVATCLDLASVYPVSLVLNFELFWYWSSSSPTAQLYLNTASDSTPGKVEQGVPVQSTTAMGDTSEMRFFPTVLEGLPGSRT